jgi:hypothetical protein
MVTKHDKRPYTEHLTRGKDKSTHKGLEMQLAKIGGLGGMDIHCLQCILSVCNLQWFAEST